MKPPELTDSQWREVLQGLALAEYSLILGAGASIGSSNSAGESLPTGMGLRDRLLERYSIPEGKDQGLRQIYDLAQLVARNRGITRPTDLIRPWFSGCSVPDWYGDLVATPWRVIWNLNIDDVLIKAYREVFRSRARQDVRVMAWRDPWTAQRDPLDRVRVVHLHGEAKSGDLIFGSLEYLAAASGGGAAHTIFADEWVGGLPTIVIGASLDDELDLAVPLLGKDSVTPSRPSILVKPSFSAYDQFRLEQAGLIPVRMTAEDFFDAVRGDWEVTLAAIEKDHVPGTLGLNPMALAFLRSFRSPANIADRWHDFYAGDEPLWGDLDESLDAIRVISGVPAQTNIQPIEGLRVYAFHGELSGTTTAEMRFLEDARKSGRAVLEYWGEGRFDARAVHYMAKQGGRQLLRIPRLDDFADAAGELEALCRESKAPVTLVTSLRSSRLPTLELHLAEALWPIKVADRLSQADSSSLLAKLAEQNRLNILLELNEKERLQFVLESHRASLVDSLAAITRGRSFTARYTEAYTEVNGADEQRILDLILLASEARVELTLGILGRAAKVTAPNLRQYLSSSPLVRLVQLSQNGGVSARHWGLAARAAGQVLTADRRFAGTLDLVHALAPYVHPTTISQRTKEVVLVARLMDAQRVVAAFGRERAAQLYDVLEPTFAWNSRFWEQRALAELEATSPRYERAEAWAREAVNRHEDGLSLNTLATVLLRRSVATLELDEGAFFDGLEVVNEARLKSIDRVTEHPYVTAFSYLRRGRALARDQSLKGRVDQVFNFWRLEVESSLAWAQEELRRDLERSIKQYLKQID